MTKQGRHDRKASVRGRKSSVAERIDAAERELKALDATVRELHHVICSAVFMKATDRRR